MPTILTRLQPYEQDLVPEMIILHGRQSQHQEALRLLTHGLGDFNTAISYCLYGYTSIFRPIPSSRSSSSHPTTLLPISPPANLPTRTQQSTLFNALLQEFLLIDDLAQRVLQTGQLLERFSAWFDVASVLAVLPDAWSVDIFSAFLINSLQRIVREKAESGVVKALQDAVNSQVSFEVASRREAVGATVERAGV